MRNYIAHLAADSDPRLTACGEPWQGWQEPFDADLASPPGYEADPPHHYDPPRPHVDRVRPCLACQRVAMGDRPPNKQAPAPTGACPPPQCLAAREEACSGA